eukprot:SAG22_NODE_699_length_7801_cov_6.003116_7_plen_81_part_00
MACCLREAVAAAAEPSFPPRWLTVAATAAAFVSLLGQLKKDEIVDLPEVAKGLDTPEKFAAMRESPEVLAWCKARYQPLL